MTRRGYRTTLITIVLALIATMIVAFTGPSASGASTKPRRAATVLVTLKVGKAGSMSGYTRHKFGTAWTDMNGEPKGHNGCDTRDDILRRDLTKVKLRSGSKCVVIAGRLVSPYTGKTTVFKRGVRTSAKVQIDHVVALGDAWTTGAAHWSKTKRVNIANDPLNLLAVDRHSNESKGDRDAAHWLPTRAAYDCAYVARQIAVKAKYKLRVTTGERTAMRHVLKSCPKRNIPTEASGTGTGNGGLGGSGGAGSNHPAHIRYIDYANCTAMNKDYPHGVARKGAHDHVSSGSPVTDFYVNTKLYNLNTSHDGDKDGVACERG